MDTISISLSESLHAQVMDLAAKDGFPIDEWIKSAIAEKVDSVKAQEFLGKSDSNCSAARYGTSRPGVS